MNKRRVLGIVLFIVIGLFMFTFANPNDKVEEGNKKVDDVKIVTPDNEGENNGANNNVANNNNVVPAPKQNNNVPNIIPVVNPTNENEQNEQNGQNEEPVVDPVIVFDLEQYKKDKIQELIDYNKDVLYSEENQIIVSNIKVTGIEEITNSTTKEDVDTALQNAKDLIDKVEKLVDTYFTVNFYGFDGKLVDTQSVLYKSGATAPSVPETITNKGITYSFEKWSVDYSEVVSKLDVYALYSIDSVFAVITDKEQIGTIKITIDETIENIINNNTYGKVTDDITNLVNKEDLPVSKEYNKKYIFTELDYTENGFVIKAELVDDEDAILAHTVIIKYVVSGNLLFEDNTQEIISKTVNEYNEVKLPSVFVNGKLVNVVWQDQNGKLEKGYSKSVTITGTLDTGKPVIELTPGKDGKVNVTEFEHEGFYKELGYKVTDNYTKLTNDDVVVVIKDQKGNTVENIDYSKVGEYTITYTVVDSEGNIGEATRIVTVKKVEVEGLVLSTYGPRNYFIDDSMEEVKVYLKYNNGEKEELKEQKCVTRFAYGFFPYDECTDGYIKTKFDNKNIGNDKSVTYTYGKLKPVEYKYNIIENKVESIKVVSDNNTYYEGDSKNFTVYAVYTKNNEEVKLAEKACNRYGYCTDGYIVDGFDTTEAGTDKTATISYKDVKPVEYKYNVIKNTISLKVVSDNNTYYEGDSKNFTVYAVSAKDKKEVKLAEKACNRYGYCTDGYVVDGFDTTEAGTDKIATISYEDAEKPVEYKYDVIKNTITLKVVSNDNSYIAGDSKNFTVYAVSAKDKKEVKLEEKACNRYGYCTDGYVVDGFDTTTVGNGKTATISYDGAEKSVEYVYDVKYKVILHDNNGSYYLEFDSNISVVSINGTDANGNAYIVEKRKSEIKNGKFRYYIDKNDYLAIHNMKGDNEKQYLDITYKVNNEDLKSRYTKAVTIYQ